MAVAGPVRAVVGGLVATATTEKALETLEEHSNKRNENLVRN